jgi:putative transferase (TIGR04331 family)
MTEELVIPFFDPHRITVDQPSLILHASLDAHRNQSGPWLRFAEPIRTGSAIAGSLRLESRSTELLITDLLIQAIKREVGETFNHRSGRVLFGHWLRRTVETAMNRCAKYLVSIDLESTPSIGVIREHEFVPPQTSTDFLFAMNTFPFHYEWTSTLLKFLTAEFLGTALSEKEIEYRRPEFLMPSELSKQFFSKSIIWRTARSIDHIAGKLNPGAGLAVISPYMNRLAAASLQMSCGQLPRIFASSDPAPHEQPDQQLRSRLVADMKAAGADPRQRSIAALVAKSIPVCYLEGLPSLLKAASSSPYPSNPKVVLAGNGFDNDEVFKAYLARQIDRGARYWVIQHGNNYGTHRGLSPAIEEETSDRFLTWGWSRDPHHDTPIGVLKRIWRKSSSSNHRGYLLYVRNTYPFPISIEDADLEFIKSEPLEGQLLSQLPTRIRNNVRVRPHSFEKHIPWVTRSFNETFDLKIPTDTSRNYYRSRNGSRLVVFGYDSTGFLENLRDEFPSILFSPTGFAHLDDGAKTVFHRLMDAGLAFEDPENLALHIESIWQRVDEWWREDKVVLARSQFASQFALRAQKPIRSLRRQIRT